MPVNTNDCKEKTSQEMIQTISKYLLMSFHAIDNFSEIERFSKWSMMGP